MPTKFKFNKTCFFVTFFLFFLLAQPLFAKNVLSRPRKMFLIKTEHFDIIYSNESEETALLLAENADLLYKKAAEKLGSQLNLHMPVIISPDSDTLSVEYTPSPYNRIIIFDSPADYETAVFKDALFSLFYREILLALAQSIRSPFNQFIARWIAGEEYQPVALLNLPYSFVEGIAYLAESEKGENPADSEGRLYDHYFLQILAQAKLENKFPKWIQVSTVRDTYPGQELAYAAGAGFAAFLMNTYGIEKYAQLWQESGKLNPLLTYGVFFNTYGMSLDELWKQFEASVPLPEKLLEIAEVEKQYKTLFQTDKEANYEHLLLTEYGLVWYDKLRHEVDIFDEKNGAKIRQLLFLADNINRLSISPDGRYLAVSHTQKQTMKSLSASSTWIYDLKTRKFLDAKYQLRDSAIVMTSQGHYALAGVNVSKAHASLEIYTMPLDDEKDEEIVLLSSYDFERNEIPFSPVYAGNGFIAFIHAEGSERYLCKLGFDVKAPKSKWLITNSSADQIKIQGLNLIYNSGRGAPDSLNSADSLKPLYAFTFTMPGEHSFTRAGFIYLSENYEPETIKLASADVSGGMNYPLLSQESDTLYYSAKKFSVNQMQTLAFSSLPMEEGQLSRAGESDFESAVPVTTLEDYNVRHYNPLKYMVDLSFTPFFPIKQIDLNEGILYWPGLGLTVESQADPCTNTRVLLSAGWTYLPLDFSWTKNMPSTYIAKLREESQNISKDKSAAFYIENSSTPVYLQAGSLFNCNRSGEYTLKFMAGGQWSFPVGIALRHMIFDFQFHASISTDYYDQSQAELRPSLSDWPSFEDAYRLYQLSLKIEYTNIHQYGYSSFAKRGFSFGMRGYTMWDMCEVELLKEARKEKEAGGTNESGLTNAQRQSLLSESLADITQINVGLFTTIAVPRLIPLPLLNNWVVSMPALIKAEFVNKSGTALEASGELLLVGYEMHNSVIPALLYARRAGLWFGYNMALVYDTTEVRLPDIRHRNYLADVFTDVSYTHAFYMILNLDLNCSLGKLSSVPINSTLTGTFYPESKGYKITLDLRFHL